MMDPYSFDGKSTPTPGDRPYPHLPPRDLAQPTMQFTWQPAPAEKAKPPVWPVYVAFISLFAAQFIAGIVWTVIWIGMMHPNASAQKFDVEAAMRDRFFVMPLLGFAVACTVLTAVVVGWGRWKERLNIQRPRAHLGVIALMVLGVLALSHAMTCLIALAIPPTEQGTMRALGQVITDSHGVDLFSAIAVIGLGAGIGEELFFRGFCQTQFLRRSGPAMAIIGTSILFGLIHLDLVHSPFAFFLGLYLGWVSFRTGSVLPAILCHTVNNVLAVIEGAVGDPLAGGNSQDAAILFVVMVICVVVCAIVIVCAELLMRRRNRKLQAAL